MTRFGPPEVLELREVPVPEPGSGQVRVKVNTAGVNYADIMQREGLYPGGPQPPCGAGFEVAGVVERVGPGVSEWAPGDAVMGFCASGYSEYVVTDAATLLAKPESLDFRQAAAIPCQYMTAYHALLTLGQLHAGQTVLIQAAAGGLGVMLVQIARLCGATVLGTCSSEEKCGLLRELDCPHPINYAELDFESEVNRITRGEKCDLVVESVGGKVFEKSLNCVKPRGRLITLGVASKKLPSLSAMTLLMNNLTVSGFHLFAYASDAAAMANAVRDLHEWVSSGALRVIVKHVYPLEKAADAHRDIAARKTVGKVVLGVASA